MSQSMMIELRGASARKSSMSPSLRLRPNFVASQRTPLCAIKRRSLAIRRMDERGCCLGGVEPRMGVVSLVAHHRQQIKSAGL
jgi:hypothetical protein